MYALAKQAREKMKAKARSFASEKDQKVDSSDWTPPAFLRAEIKTGARPIMKPSSKGIGESNAAADTKAAIGRDMKRGAFKAGGAVKDAGVKNKAALGAIDPSPKRGPAGHYKKGGTVKRASGGLAKELAESKLETKEAFQQHKDYIKKHGSYDPADKGIPEKGYKKGGKTKKAGGGSILEKLVGKPKTGSDLSQVGKMGTANYTQEQKGALNRALNKDDSLPEPAEAAERSGKYQNYKKGGRAERKAGGRTRAKGKTNINIVIAAGRKAGPEAPALDMAAGMPSAPANIPVPMPGAGAPPPAALPMGGPPGAPMPGIPGGPMGRKAGGRISKVASSYKDMTASAATGEGRLQKTDIAKKHHDAPGRKAGGKVYSSYRDMDAGAGSGPGRQEKTEIEKKQRARGK